MGMVVFLRKENASFPGTHKIGAAISGPRVAGKKCYGHGDFSESGKKKEPKPKLFGPGIFGWGGGLPRAGVGAKKFGMSFKKGNQTFVRDIPGFFFWHFPGGPEKFEKKVCVQFLVL